MSFPGLGDRGGRGGGGDRGRGRGGNESKESPEAATRRAEREQRDAAREVYRQQRLGPSGEVPRGVPDATRHAGGRFTVADLEPGRYVFDIRGPGYVAVAAGVVEVKLGETTRALTFELERGRRIRGRVVDGNSGDGVAKADVDLVLPPSPDDAAAPAPGGRPNFGRGRRGGRGGRATTLASVVTDGRGYFELPPQRPGRFELRVEAENRPPLSQDVIVAAGDDLTDLVLAVRGGGRVHGTVRGLQPDERATVVLTHTDGSRDSGDVDEDGGYEVIGLKDGGYFVRVELRDGERGGRRSRLGGFLVAMTGQAPDLVVREGADVSYDPTVDESHLGTVKGSVTINNAPASGYEVRMQPEGEVSLSGRAAGLLRGRVQGDGSFEISMLPPGPYTLELQRRGRRGGGVVHREQLVISAGGVIDRRFSLVLGALSLKVTMADDGTAVKRSQISLVLAAEAAGRDRKEWSKLSSFRRSGLRGGAVELPDLPLGNYLYAIRGAGFAESTGSVSVTGGAATPLAVTVARAQAKKK